MRRLALLLVAIGPMIALPAVAQAPGAAERARVAGTVEKLDGDRLTVNVAGSGTQTVMLSADAKIYGVEKRRLSDIKPGDFVASGGVRGTDGQIHAVELRIFPESMRGVGEGQRPWDVKPEGVMTNATVGTYRRRPTAASSMLPTRAASPNMSSDPMSRCWPMSWRTERC